MKSLRLRLQYSGGWVAQVNGRVVGADLSLGQGRVLIARAGMRAQRWKLNVNTLN